MKRAELERLPDDDLAAMFKRSLLPLRGAGRVWHCRAVKRQNRLVDELYSELCRRGQRAAARAIEAAVRDGIR
jgi:hypothetical protein